MKRQIFALAVCTVLLTTSIVNAEIVLLNEDFDGGLAGWTTQDNNADSYTWSAVTSDFYRNIGEGAYADLDADRLYYEDWAETDWNDSLISSTINVTGMSSVNVSADIFYQDYYTGGYAAVNYSVDNGQTWNQLQKWEYTGGTELLQNGTANWDINLSTGVTALLVSFDCVQPDVDYHILQVDNVMVTGTSVPEPATISLLGLGLAGLIRSRRKA